MLKSLAGAGGFERRLAERAKRESVSLNTLAVTHPGSAAAFLDGATFADASGSDSLAPLPAVR